jgi:hypothetical protein
MKVAGSFAGRSKVVLASTKLMRAACAPAALIAALLAQILAPSAARAQAPYLLPYTIQVLAGGGTTPTVGATCTSPTTGVSGIAYDSFGDGCPVNSPAVVAGGNSDLHDVVVDQEGNVYFLDNTSAVGVVRRIDAHSGIISVYIGSFVTQTAICAATQDKYGDGCPSSDGKANANASGGYTGNIGKARGLGIDKAGNVYLADYTNSVAHKVTASTDIMTMVAGSLNSSTKLVANGGVKGFSGDGGIAFNPNATPTPQGAALDADRGIAADQYGDVFIADSTNNVIRLVYNGGPAAAALIALTNPGKTATVGYIYTVVGSDANAPSAATAATAGASNGNGGPAASALLLTPEDVAVDNAGNLFIADFGTNEVRVVYAGGATVATLIAKTNGGITPVVGNIYDVVGNGVVVTATTPPTPTTSNPNPQLATSVPIGSPRKIDIDSRDNIIVADNGNNVIWFVDATTGYMRVVAGTLGATGTTSSTGGPVATYCAAHTDAFGDNCPGTQAALNPNSAMGVSVDSQENIYIGDSGDQRLRKVYTNQTFPSTPAGTSVTQTILVHFAAGDSPAATNPYVISGSADYTVAPGACTTNADNTTDCFVTVTFLPSKPGLDTSDLVIKSISNGSSTFGLTGIGAAPSIAFDPGQTASVASTLNLPQGVALDAAGNTYIADTANNRVLMISAAGVTSTLAGTGTAGYTGDGTAATAATLNGPKAVAVTRSGLIYIADTGNNVIRQINPVTGTISTVAGAATAVCSTASDALGDQCLGTSATLKAPAGLAADGNGNIYIADSGNNLVRELTYSGYIFLTGGGASTVCSTGDVFGNGCAPSAAIFSNPTGLAVDSAGNIYIADSGDSEVRKIVAGTATIVALGGTGQAGSSGNGGAATGAQLSTPSGVAVDAAGDVYIADTGNSVIRFVNASGNISTAVGTLGASGTGTLPGSAFAVQLSSPAGVATTGGGTLVVLDSGNNRAFTDNRGSVSYNFGRTNPGSSSPTLQIEETSTGSASAAIGSGSGLFTPTPAPPFALAGTGSSACTSETLAPGSSCLLLAGFNPSATQLGSFSQTYTEAAASTTTPAVTLSPAPFISLTGVAAVLTPTSSVTVVTSPATGSPQYSIPFTVTTTVTPTVCNTGAPTCFPTGSVTFFVDGTQVGLPATVSATGTASTSITGLNVGSHTVTAVYSGDSFYASSSAAALTVSVGRGSTASTIALSPATGQQFTAFNLSATVTSQTSNIPTGTFTFYAAGVTTALGSASIDARTGVATLADTLVPTQALTPAHYANFGLNVGTYGITAVYSGDSNYAPSTTAAATLTITANSASFTVSLAPSTAGTAQGSTATVVATISANNTFAGTIGFTCTNMPAHSTCTFGPPTTLTFAAVPGVPTEQQINITMFTDIPTGVTQTTSELLGWPVLLFSVAGMLAFRRRLRNNPRAMRLLTVVALFGILTGGSILMSGCSSSNSSSTQLTPVGTYTVNFVAAGPNNQTITTPITFIVGKGEAGEL